MAAVFAAMLASAPAQADASAAKTGWRQCFKFSLSYERDAWFGRWNACLQAASGAVPPAASWASLRAALAAPSQRMKRFTFGSCAGLFGFAATFDA